MDNEKPIEKIEIQDPPLEELKKKRSCLRRGCFTGCGCIVFLLIGIALLFKFVIIPRPVELASVPPSFPEAIPLYDRGNISRIEFLSGEKEQRLLQLAAFIARKSDLLTSLALPLSARDQLRIEWHDLSATPKFIENFYQTELKKNHIATATSSQSDTLRQFTFATTTIDGAVIITDDPAKDGTDSLELIINYPTEK
ncbi:MAG: hypothetical protein AAB932_06165 [Patescibacteria group bacterium]